MRWKTLSKAEAEKQMNSWGEIPSWEYDPEYQGVRADLIDAMKEVATELNVDVSALKRETYNFDLRFGLKLYRILNERYSMDLRNASDDGVWRYMSIYVIPDIVYLRWGLKASRFWKESRRIWSKTLWWYIYLSWQGDYEKTFEVLKGNTTDEIVQLVERSGSSGYRVELCRKIIAKYGEIPEEHRTRSEQLFRKVLKLNTARVKVIEPALVPGGEAEYVKELFEYFEH